MSVNGAVFSCIISFGPSDVSKARRLASWNTYITMTDMPTLPGFWKSCLWCVTSLVAPPGGLNSPALRVVVTDTIGMTEFWTDFGAPVGMGLLNLIARLVRKRRSSSSSLLTPFARA